MMPRLNSKYKSHPVIKFYRVFSAALVAIFIVAASASAATLRIGDYAPPLQAGKWLQGEPVRSFDSNHVYVVEFWATWWAPCRTSLSRLNGIAEKYSDRGLVAIAQDVFEKDESSVPAFLNKMDDKITCRMALDDKSQDTEGAMAVSWMKAAGQTGVPIMFVVNRHGRIAWIGHPMLLEQSVIEAILDDKFDSAAYAEQFEKQQGRQDLQKSFLQQLATELKTKDWDAATATVGEIEKGMPVDSRYKISPVRMQILLHRKDFSGAYKLAESTSDSYPNDIYMENEMAWDLASTEGVDRQGLDLAKKLAMRANVAANWKNSGVLDTLARTQFLTGETNEAVATEQKALDVATDEMKPNLKQWLNDYQQGRLPEVKE